MRPNFPGRAEDLGREIGRWLANNPSWYLREQEPYDDFQIHWLPLNRYATSDEIAAEIVNDPVLRDALGFLTSPPGQAIEEAVDQLWLPPLTAQILTDGLTAAWRAVLDQKRPAWQRAEVLVAAVLVVAVISLVIWTDRKAS